MENRIKMLIELEENNHRLEVMGNRLEDMLKKIKATRDRTEEDSTTLESIEEATKDFRKLLYSI